jgi:hypothetical protein
MGPRLRGDDGCNSMLARMRACGDSSNSLFHKEKWIPAFAGMTAAGLLRTRHSIFTSSARRKGIRRSHDGNVASLAAGKTGRSPPRHRSKGPAWDRLPVPGSYSIAGDRRRSADRSAASGGRRSATDGAFRRRLSSAPGQ